MTTAKSLADDQREQKKSEKEEADQEKRIQVSGSYIDIELDPDSSGLARRVQITVLKDGIEVYTNFQTGKTALLPEASNIFKVLNIH